MIFQFLTSFIVHPNTEAYKWETWWLRTIPHRPVQVYYRQTARLNRRQIHLSTRYTYLQTLFIFYILAAFKLHNDLCFDQTPVSHDAWMQKVQTNQGLLVCTNLWFQARVSSWFVATISSNHDFFVISAFTNHSLLQLQQMRQSSLLLDGKEARDKQTGVYVQTRTGYLFIADKA